jgi:AraC-like DNA-binding protein
MNQVQYKISKVIYFLKSILNERKTIYTHQFQNYQLKIEGIQIETGLYFINLEICTNERIQFIQEAEKLCDWTMVLYLNNARPNLLDNGVYTVFDDQQKVFIVEPTQECKISIILLNDNFKSIYNRNKMFDDIRNQNIYKLPLSNQLINLIAKSSYLKGLVRIKKSIFELLDDINFQIYNIETQLRNNIETICKKCWENKLNISITLALDLGLDIHEVNKYTLDIFGVSLHKYYHNFKIENTRKFLRNEKEALNALFLSNIHRHSPDIDELMDKFSLNEPLLKKIFEEELGQSICKYYQKLKFLQAKNYLLHSPKKVYQISQCLGYSQPTDMIQFFHRNEGTTPKQLLIKVRKNLNAF